MLLTRVLLGKLGVSAKFVVTSLIYVTVEHHTRAFLICGRVCINTREIADRLLGV